MNADRPYARALLLGAVVILTFATCRDNRDATAPRTDRGADAGPSPVAPTSELSPEGAHVLVGAGDIASCTTENDAATAALLDGIEGTVFTLGDNAYSTGSATEFSTCYESTWGRHKARTRPTLGDRDYGTTGAAGYGDYFGAAAGEPGKFYYSYDVGDWHVISLNAKLTSSAATQQLAWLAADLEANTKPCTIAYFHKPYLSSTSGRDAARKPFWDLLYKHGAELVLSADNRYYERFGLQDPNEVADAAHGIRQFIVGTGGAGKTAAPSTRRAHSEVLHTGTPGVLKLTLGAGEYAWEFVPIAGMSFTDAGTGTCHGAPVIAHAGGPYKSEGTVVFDGSKSFSTQDGPLTYAWDFGDGNTSTEAAPSHTYAADGAYTVSLVVTDAAGGVSAPATTTATIGNLPPSLELFARTSVLGAAITPRLTFTDPGGAGDGPWSYQVDWGDGTSSTGVVTEQGDIALSHMYPAIGRYLATATVTDKDGGVGTDPGNMAVISPTGGAVILAAGDIAKCNVSGGPDSDELTAQILDAHPTATIFTLGDNAYPDGTDADYQNCYDPTWGRGGANLARTYATLGNHEYDISPTPTFNYFGSRAGAPGTHPSCSPGVTPRGIAYNCEGYYSVDIGDWHVVVLNDNIPIGSTSGQLAWLREIDLPSSTKKCQLVLWHQPRFMSTDTPSSSSPTGWFSERTTRRSLWDRLFLAGVEIALNAHQHFYERHHPMNALGERDDVNGILQLMVGTGGESTKDVTTLPFIHPNSAVRSGDFGVLKLTLHPNAYEFQFLAAPGYTFADTGSGVCR